MKTAFLTIGALLCFGVLSAQTDTAKTRTLREKEKQAVQVRKDQNQRAQSEMPQDNRPAVAPSTTSTATNNGSNKASGNTQPSTTPAATNTPPDSPSNNPPGSATSGKP